MARHRVHFLAGIGVAALVAASCSQPNDVLVSQSNSSGNTLPAVATTNVDEQPPSTDPGVTTPPTPDTTPGTRPGVPGSAGLVLSADDVPGWDHFGPWEVGEEPTFESLDCDLVNTVWSVAGSGGTRSRASIHGVAFRNTAVDMGSAEAAAAVMDAADVVWDECVLFEGDTGTWWSEPLPMPIDDLRSAGLVFGSDDAPGWAHGLWQVGNTIIVLEVSGDDVWNHFTPLFETLSARLGGAPKPLPPEPAPVNTNATDIAVPPVDTDPVPELHPAPEPPPEVGPEAPPEPIVPTAFPPTDEDWVEHPLARLAPHPADIGNGWEYSSGRTSEAQSADPDDAITGCDAPVPPTLDGVEISYRGPGQDDSYGRDLEVNIWRGTPEQGDAIVATFVAIAACDLSEVGFDQGLQLVEVSVEGADSSVALAGTTNFGEYEASMTIVIARSGELVTMAYLGVDAALDPVETAGELGALLSGIIAAV